MTEYHAEIEGPDLTDYLFPYFVKVYQGDSILWHYSHPAFTLWGARRLAKRSVRKARDEEIIRRFNTKEHVIEKIYP